MKTTVPKKQRWKINPDFTASIDATGMKWIETLQNPLCDTSASRKKIDSPRSLEVSQKGQEQNFVDPLGLVLGEIPDESSASQESYLLRGGNIKKIGLLMS